MTEIELSLTDLQDCIRDLEAQYADLFLAETDPVQLKQLWQLIRSCRACLDTARRDGGGVCIKAA